MKMRELALIYLAYILLSSELSEVHGACQQYAYPTATEITADGTIQLIQSQNYPSPYENDERCQWHVTAGSADSRIIIHVRDFSSEGTNVGCPSKDYATIFDGADDTANEIFRVCPGSANQKRVYVSSTNEIFVQFRSDAFTTNSGISIAVFTIDSSSQPACSTTLTATSTPQYLHSNNLPSSYGASYGCVHTFVFAASASTNGVQFDVHFLDIETSTSCADASLTISGGDDSVTQSTEYTLCNSSDIFVESTYTVRKTVSQLTFTTTSNVDSSVDYYGFVITYQTSIDECASSPCENGGTCTDGHNSFTCQCPVGFDTTTCGADDCASTPCTNGGTCTDAVYMSTCQCFTCQCADGYEGTTCNTDTDECASNPCANGGTCTDGVNSFTCQCVAGYEGTTCNTNTDECASSPCANGGTCTDGVNSFACQCVAGYEGNTCNTNTDECASSPCMNGGTCTDGVNSFTCQCAAGYEGTTCNTDTDECASSPCANGGTCTDGVNSFTCQCVAGYEGTTCNTNTNECASSPCANGGTCTDGVNSFTCQCAAGYEGTTCNTDTDECASSPCANGGTCTDGVNSFICQCVAGYEGTTCNTNTNECASSPCANGGTCIDGVNSFTCQCAGGYEGITCNTDTDECASSPCVNNGTCTDGVNRFTCQCAAGYEGITCSTVSGAKAVTDDEETSVVVIVVPVVLAFVAVVFLAIFMIHRFGISLPKQRMELTKGARHGGGHRRPAQFRPVYENDVFIQRNAKRLY